MRKVFLLVAAVAIGCGSSSSGGGGGTPQTATPTFSPAAGTYATAQSVTIACATAGATIYYTTDGTDPTTASAVYSSPVAVATSETLRAMATASGHTASAVASAAYTISGTTPQAATPTFSPAPGTYATTQSVTIACATAGATIYYTTDGSNPTTSASVYSGAISVASSKTVKAIATATGFTTSAVGSAIYTISSGGSTNFTTLCQGSLSAFTTLETTCLHANPDFVSAFFTDGFFSCSVIGKEITAGRVTYNATQGTACASAFASLTCAQLASSTLPTACASVLSGTVPNASSCYLDEDCAAGWCNSTSSLCPGTCQAFAQLNQSCATATCAPGLECDSTQSCKARSAVNGACPCQDGLWCDTTGGAPGICKAPQTSGACDASNSGQCSIGFVCAGTPSTTCQALVGLGGDCTAAAELCGLGYSCDASNKCVSFPKLGEACSASNPFCIGSFCDVLGTLKCTAYKRIGDACSLPADLLACEPGSTCDAVTSKCKASPPAVCQAP